MELRERITNFIKSYEKLRDIILYPEKKPSDKILCPVCGFHYNRRFRSRHKESIIHITEEMKIYNGTGVFHFESIMTDIK